MKFRLIPAMLLASLLPVSLAAQSNEIGAWAAGSRVSDTTTDAGRLKFDTAYGYAVSLNHFWTNHLATELAWGTTRGSGTISVGGAPVLDAGKLKLNILTATAQWHFNRTAMLDPYAGVGFVSVGARDLKSNDLTAAGVNRVVLRDGSGPVGNAGVDVNVSSRWGIAVDGKYFRYRPRATAAGTDVGRLKLNPVVISAGLRLRF